MTKTSTVTVSDALKEHLDEIKRDNTEHSVDGVDTLHGAMAWLLDGGHDEQIAIDGYDETLDEPVKVPLPLLERVREAKADGDYRDYEELLRDRGNIEQREMGEQPIEITKI